MIGGLVGRALHEFAVGGVNESIPGNGGPECVNFLPYWQKILETAVFVPLSLYALFVSIDNLEYPKRAAKRVISEACDGSSSRSLLHRVPDAATNGLPFRRYVFNFYAGVFFVELIYKTFTRTGIFFLNPCHVTTTLQLLLLKMPDDHPMTTQIFRFSMYTTPGALIAIAFPILNTRLFSITGEVLIYFVQHLLIVLIPLYLMSLNGAFVPESTFNLGWPLFSMSAILLYHFLFLQPISYLSHVNLNCILCPAVSDPFAGRFYRLCAIGHQFLLVPIVTKLYNYSFHFIHVPKPKTK